jgi:hypothetical protein
VEGRRGGPGGPPAQWRGGTGPPAYVRRDPPPHEARGKGPDARRARMSSGPVTSRLPALLSLAPPLPFPRRLPGRRRRRDRRAADATEADSRAVTGAVGEARDSAPPPVAAPVVVTGDVGRVRAGGTGCTVRQGSCLSGARLHRGCKAMVRRDSCSARVHGCVVRAGHWRGTRRGADATRGGRGTVPHQCCASAVPVL